METIVKTSPPVRESRRVSVATSGCVGRAVSNMNPAPFILCRTIRYDTRPGFALQIWRPLTEGGSISSHYRTTKAANSRLCRKRAWSFRLP